MKTAFIYYCMLLMAMFSFKTAKSQMESPEKTAKQAQKELTGEQGDEKDRKKRAKAAKKLQPKGDTDAKYAWHFKKRKKSKERGSKREIAKREYE